MNCNPLKNPIACKGFKSISHLFSHLDAGNSKYGLFCLRTQKTAHIYIFKVNYFDFNTLCVQIESNISGIVLSKLIAYGV